MIVEFNLDLSMQKIYAADYEKDMLFGEHRRDIDAEPDSKEILISSFANPRLVIDSDRIFRLPLAERESLLTLLTSSSRVARFSKTEHHVNKAKYPLVWAPSIDTFVMCSALHTLDFQSVRTAVEIGCGSGFIGKYLLEKVHEDASIDLIDIDDTSVVCAQEAINSPRVSYYVQKAQDYLAQRQFDLVVSNPPYLPCPDGNDRPPFGGTTLMEFLCNNAASFLTPRGRLILLQSSITLNDFENTFSGNGLKTRVLHRREVPLKVTSVLNDEKWCSYLSGLKGVRQNSMNGYVFSHELIVVEVSKL